MAGTNPGVLRYLRNNPLARGLGRYAGRNVPRAIGREVSSILGGTLSSLIPGALGVPSGGATLLTVPAAYYAGSSGATALYETVMNNLLGTDNPVIARKTEPVVIEEKPNKSVPEEITDAELAALNETIQPIVPESVNPPPPQAPRSESGSSAALPGQDSVLSTPSGMQSELLKEATTMRRAKEMKELGITGGDEAMNKGSAMHTWLSTHGDMADNLIRDKRMREVRIAREFGRDLPTDARGLDGQMGNFEAFRANREEFA
jgi:hypothetical protein